jgi:predicted nucleic acid-binding protein
MAASGPRKQLALDTNLLLNLAAEKEFAHDFRERFLSAGYALRFPPTVLAELVAAEMQGNEAEQRLAGVALSKIASWQLRPFDLTSIEEAIAGAFARKLLHSALLPPEELNDCLILSETSVAAIPLLVTSDQHLLNIEEEALLLLFNRADLLPVYPTHPRRLLRALIDH